MQCALFVYARCRSCRGKLEHTKEMCSFDVVRCAGHAERCLSVSKTMCAIFVCCARCRPCRLDIKHTPGTVLFLNLRAVSAISREIKAFHKLYALRSVCARCRPRHGKFNGFVRGVRHAAETSGALPFQCDPSLVMTLWYRSICLL